MPSIKDFSIVKIVSRGAFGQVFLGYKNTDESKLFAIKVSFMPKWDLYAAQYQRLIMYHFVVYDNENERRL